MASPHVFAATDQDFRTSVLERSQRQPVLVDFWATWCGPCQVLGPVLERLADEMGGAFALAKVDTDANPGLAAAFQIRSIPTVVLMKDGRPVDAFMGALPEAQVRDFLAPHLAGPPAPTDPLEDARTRIEDGDLAGAKRALEPLVRETPDHPAARLLLARVALLEGDEPGVRAHVDAIPATADERRDAERLVEALAFRAACGDGAAGWEARLAKDPDDLEARYGLGCCHAVAGRHEAALAAFLEVVRRDRSWRDEAARKAMVAVFGLLGPGNDLAREYRRQLAILL